ncbi:MAG: hypothetical protein ACP5HG_11440, partial [Anaerolineae bacterium]
PVETSRNCIRRSTTWPPGSSNWQTRNRKARAQRGRLMNRLLPLLARHFPLEDVDILRAFGGLEEAPEPDWEGL